mgnify:CR=1 FL=1
MHGDAALTPVALVAGYLVRYGVPLVCAVIAIDAARRPAAALGARRRIVWIVLPVALLAGLVAGFVAPGVAGLQLLAVAALPLAVVMSIVYLLTVVANRSRPTPDEQPPADGTT